MIADLQLRRHALLLRSTAGASVEVDEDELAAIHRAQAKHPESVFCVLRVGHRATHRMETVAGGDVLVEPMGRPQQFA